MNRLRRLAVYVDEPIPGRFLWELVESDADLVNWTVIGEGEQSYTTWIEAYYAGSAALIDLVDDERTGPRAQGTDEDATTLG